MAVLNLKTGNDHDTDSEKYYPKQDPKILLNKRMTYTLQKQITNKH